MSSPNPNTVLRAHFGKAFENPGALREPVVIIGHCDHQPEASVNQAAEGYAKQHGAKLLVDEAVDQASTDDLIKSIAVVNIHMKHVKHLLPIGLDEGSREPGKEDQQAIDRLMRAKGAQHVVLNVHGNVDIPDGFYQGAFKPQKPYPRHWPSQLEKLREFHPNVIVVGSFSYMHEYSANQALKGFGQANHVFERRQTVEEFLEYAREKYPKAAGLGMLDVLERRPELFDTPPRELVDDLVGTMGRGTPANWNAVMEMMERCVGELENFGEYRQLLVRQMLRSVDINLGRQVAEEMENLPFYSSKPISLRRSKPDTSQFLSSLGIEPKRRKPTDLPRRDHGKSPSPSPGGFQGGDRQDEKRAAAEASAQALRDLADQPLPPKIKP